MELLIKPSGLFSAGVFLGLLPVLPVLSWVCIQNLGVGSFLVRKKLKKI